MWTPDWNAIGNNLIAGAMLAIAMSATVRTGLKGIARIPLDWGQEFAFWLLVPLIFGLALVAIHLSVPSQFGVQQAEWPSLTSAELSDLADVLRQYQPADVDIIFDDPKEESLVIAFAKAMRLANWPDPSMVRQPDYPRIGIKIYAGANVIGALEPLKEFCRKHLRTEPITDTFGEPSAGPKSIVLTIGHNPSN